MIAISAAEFSYQRGQDQDRRLEVFGGVHELSSGFECCINIASDHPVYFDRRDPGSRAGKKEPARRTEDIYPGVPGLCAGHDDKSVCVCYI